MKRITGKTKSKKNNKAKKKINIKVLKKIVILFACIMFIIAILVISSMFNIKKIEINILENEGTTIAQNSGESEYISTNLNSAEIQSLSGLSIGQNMFKKSKNEIIDSIKKNPYVSSVEIIRKVNGTCVINVTERKVKYIINYAGAYIYIDEQGYVLELNSEPATVPVLLGITTDFTSLAVGTEEKITRINENDLDKLDVVNSIMDSCKNNEVDSLISRIDISDHKNYTLYLDTESKTVYLGNCKDLNTRILYMKEIIEKEKGNTGEIFINSDLDSGYVYFKENV